jgi:membrane-associated protease RseP (regulator of RpoE activity)
MSFVKQLWNTNKHVFHIFVFVIFIFLLPLRWIVSLTVAAMIHELGHYCAVMLLGGKIHNLRFGMFGAVMEASGLNTYSEIICLIAGPIAGLLTIFLYRSFPILALCGLIQSGYNLLPICPLDGGKIAQRIILIAGGTDSHFRSFERTFMMLLSLVCIYIGCRYKISLFFFCAIYLFRKTPCKPQ